MAPQGPVPQNYYPGTPSQDEQLAQLAALTQAAQGASMGEYDTMRQNQAAQSPFYAAMAQGLMAPAVPSAVTPSFDDLSGPAASDYGALWSALQGGGGMQGMAQQAPAQSGRIPGQQAFGGLANPTMEAFPISFRGPAVGARMGEGGGGPVYGGEVSGANWVGQPAAAPPEPSLQRGRGIGPSEAGWAKSAAGGTRAPLQTPAPRTQAELAYLQKMAPYITQRRVSETQGATTREKEATKGEYGERRNALKSATELAKAHMNYMGTLETARSRIAAAAKRAQKTGQKDELLKALKDGMAAAGAGERARVAAKTKLEQSGFAPTSPPIQKLEEDGERMKQEWQYYQTEYQRAVQARFPSVGRR